MLWLRKTENLVVFKSWEFVYKRAFKTESLFTKELQKLRVCLQKSFKNWVGVSLKELPKLRVCLQKSFKTEFVYKRASKAENLFTKELQKLRICLQKRLQKLRVLKRTSKAENLFTKKLQKLRVCLQKSFKSWEFVDICLQ